MLPGEHSERVWWPLGDGVWPGRLLKEKRTIWGGEGYASALSPGLSKPLEWEAVA